MYKVPAKLEQRYLEFFGKYKKILRVIICFYRTRAI